MSEAARVRGFKKWGASLLLVLVVAVGMDCFSNPARAAGCVAAGSPQASALVQPLLGLNWDNVFAPFEYVLGSRRRMVQVVTILACIALYIMVRRK